MYSKNKVSISENKWPLKYMLALVCPILPPFSDHSFPQRCMEVPNPVLGSLRKFFVKFSLKTFHNWLSFSLPAQQDSMSVPQLLYESEVKERTLKPGCALAIPQDAGSSSTQSTNTTEPQGPNHYSTSQKMPWLRNQSWASHSCLKISIYICSNAHKEKKNKKKISIQPLMAFSARNDMK